MNLVAQFWHFTLKDFKSRLIEANAGRSLMYKLKNIVFKVSPYLRRKFVGNGFVMLSLRNKETFRAKIHRVYYLKDFPLDSCVL